MNYNFSDTFEPNKYYAFNSNEIIPDNVIGSGNSRTEVRNKFGNAQRILKGSTLMNSYGFKNEPKENNKLKTALKLGGLGLGLGLAGYAAYKGLTSDTKKLQVACRDWQTDLPELGYKEGEADSQKCTIYPAKVPVYRNILHNLGIRDRSEGHYGTVFDTVGQAMKAANDTLNSDSTEIINDYYGRDIWRDPNKQHKSRDLKQDQVVVDRRTLDYPNPNSNERITTEYKYTPKFKKSLLGNILNKD